MQRLDTMTNPRALSPAEKIKLLELEDLELQLEQEARRRKFEKQNENFSGTGIITLEGRHQAFVAAYPFSEFVKESFSQIEPGREFHYNWHIDVICLLLQATVTGQVRNFIINQPRRTMKSLLSCVMFPSWVWTFLPHLRFLYTSYNKDFATRDNKACSDLINTDWYQSKFGHNFMLTTTRRDKLMNNKGGYRVVFRIGKGVGHGGDFVFADDPNDVEETESDQALDRTNRGWDEVSSQNLTDRRTAVRGEIQQRTNPNDLTGHILENPELREIYSSRLCLPMRYEEDHPDTNTPERPLLLGVVTEYDKSANPRLVIGEQKMWVDPRDKRAPEFENVYYQEWYKSQFKSLGLSSEGEGQLLWETYIGEEETLDAEKHLGNYGTSAQMQQRPIRRGGNFFNSEYFPTIPLSNIDLHDLILCRYWDKAGTEGGGDWTVGTLIARTRKKPFEVYILDMKREQVGYYERQELIKRTAEEDERDYAEPYGNDYTVAIEREPASAGKDLATIERDELIGFNVIIDRPRKAKGIRAKPVRSFSESGRLKVVLAPWNGIFFKRLEKFDPTKDNQKDDEIDTVSGGFRVVVFGNKVGNGFRSGVY